MIREVVGMVVGNGYTAKTKPESFAASSVADKHAKTNSIINFLSLIK
jgi:predicted RNase H-related nuclease YkuK (DUF458 family)